MKTKINDRFLIMILCTQLCFKKGDKITVTQKEDGGWWEGTLSGKTGWFPSNYVKECKGNLCKRKR